MKMKLLSLAVLTVIFIATAPFTAAQTTPSGIPISELEQYIDKYAANIIGTKTAGASIAAVKDGELVFSKAYGYAIQDEVKINTNSVFEWGSATKMLTWTSLMQLAEQGKINLDNDIRGYLPDGFLKKIKYDIPINFYNLMHHSAGWEDRIVDLFYANPKKVPDLKGSLQSWEPAQIYPPGTYVSYSNFGTALAGYIVECISGKPFYEYVWENIFTPLGMKDTAIHPLQIDNPVITEKRAQIKGHGAGIGKPTPSPIELIYIGLYPAGSAIGTAEDAIKFMAALMPAEGQTSVLFKDNKTLREMLSQSYQFKEGFPGIAHGFFEYFYSARSLGHGGNTAAFSSQFTIAPDERFAFIVMTNQGGETPFCYGLTKQIFGEAAPQHTTEKFPDTREFKGMFATTRKSANGFTKLITSMMMIFPIKPIDENSFDIAGAKFIQISPYVFKNTGGSDFLDIINLLYIEAKDGKVSRASIGYFDFVPLSAGRLFAINTSIILFVLCLLFFISAVIISIIGTVKNKKKNISFNLIKKLNIILYAGMAAALFNNIIMLVRAMNFTNYASLTIHFIINIVYIIAAPVCIGFIIKNWKTEPAKSSKVFNTFSMAFSFILAVILLAWEFWH